MKRTHRSCKVRPLEGTSMGVEKDERKGSGEESDQGRKVRTEKKAGKRKAENGAVFKGRRKRR